MKARIEKDILIITLFNESEIRQASDFQQANNYKKRSHELSIRFEIDLRAYDKMVPSINLEVKF